MSLHVAVLNRTTGEILHQFGRHGAGPGEFLDPMWAVPVSEKPPSVWLYDFQNRRFTLLDLGEPGRPSRWQTRRMDLGLSVTQLMRAGGRYVANGLFPDFTLLVTDTLGTPEARIRADPPFGPRAVPHPDGRRVLNRNFMAADPGGRRFVLAYQFRSRLDFFTARGERYGTVRGPRSTKPSFRVEGQRFLWNDDNEMAFQSVTATKRYVYALFCGCRVDEERAGNLIQIFRWDGAYVGELVLDHQILTLAVDESDQILYGGIEEPFPGVAEWRLPAGLSTMDSPGADASGR